MGPPGSSPRTLGEHVGWVAGSRPLDSGAPHMVPPAAEQLGTRVSRAWHLAGFSRIPGGEEPCKRAWVGCWMCKAVQHVLCLCGVVCHRLPRTVARSCRAGLPKHSSCRPFVQPCCVGSFVSVVARGIPPATQGTGQHLLRGVLAVLGRQCSSGQSAQLLSCGAVCSRITQRT